MNFGLFWPILAFLDKMVIFGKFGDFGNVAEIARIMNTRLILITF